jgi:hypothetical protein
MARRTLLMVVWAFSHCAILDSRAVAIDVGTTAGFRQQEFEAWGTSLAWFGNALGNWTNSNAHADVMDMLFDGPNHLGLNYARYNIGGGQNPLLVGNMRPGAAVPGWVPNAPASVTDTSTWNWNWNADPGQRKSLDAAIARGANRVDAVSYSAPYWMTNSYDTSGAVGGGDNLQTSLYDEYAHYQSEVLKHFRDEEGIRFRTFAPMNEPDATWWQAGGGQEGMHVSPGFNQRLLIETVGQTLVNKGIDTGISASDAFSANTSVGALGQYNATTLSYVKQINTHVYGGAGSNSTASMQSLRNLATSRNVPLYQSEYGNNSSSALSGGIDLANRITADVNVMGVNGWTFWQVIEPLSLAGSGWGLMWADYNTSGSGFVVRKQYHVMRQFTSYIRPGADILSVNDAETVAAHNSGSDTTVLVFTNDETSADSNVYDLLDKAPAYSRVIRTDENGNFVSLGPASFAGSQLTVASPGSAVSTVVIHHQPNLIQNAGFGSAGAGWQTSGNAAYNASIDNTHDGSGGIVLQANSVANSGAAWQEGIGSATTDLTGKAYEFSMDMLIQNSSLQFGADAQIGLEFYGADGQTLTHASPLDFAEEVEPISQDSEFRVFRTETVMAPTGTRFVRPVVRFDNVTPGATGLVYLDNAYLQETRYVPRARAWDVDANGAWGDGDKWQYDSLVENNRAAYFGPHITATRTITVDTNLATTDITFDSSFRYRIEGDATLTIGKDTGTALVDVREGRHTILAPTIMSGTTRFQVVGDAELSIEGSLDLVGRRLEKTGPGQLQLAHGFDMGGGTLAIEANLKPTISIGSGGLLDGTLEVSLPVSQEATWGSLYTLAEFSAPGLAFNDIVLPGLSKPWLTWNVQYVESSRLIAEVVNGADFNRDGKVDSVDLSQWSNDYGVNANSDANGNGVTDGADFLIWQRAFGEVEESNTLALVVDPATGDARIENRSSTTFVLDAYTVSSDSDSLLTTWNSLDDQGLPGWTEALPSSGRLSELNPTGDFSLASGAALTLIGLFNVEDGAQDLAFQFRDVALGTVNGRVIYASLASLTSATTAIPEPGSIWLLIAGLSLTWHLRDRKKSVGTCVVF